LRRFKNVLDLSSVELDPSKIIKLLIGKALTSGQAFQELRPNVSPRVDAQGLILQREMNSRFKSTIYVADTVTGQE